MSELLVPMQGSKRDPAYNEQMLKLGDGEVPFLDYFRDQGIKVCEPVVTSCHGNTKLAEKHAEQIQKLADEGHKVVVVAQGGLYFALPSIIAANAPTVPVISIPLDSGDIEGLDAFLGPRVPTGTAAIGGVYVDNYQTAANVAKEILLGEFDGVYTYKGGSKKLCSKLESLGIRIKARVESEKPESGLVVGCVDVGDGEFRAFESYGSVGILTPKRKVGGDGKEKNDYYAAVDLSGYCRVLNKSVWTRGDENVAILAAKVVSANNPTAFEALKDMAKNKREGYEKRDITIDSFT